MQRSLARCLVALALFAASSCSKKHGIALSDGSWRGSIHREDSRDIVFSFDLGNKKGENFRKIVFNVDREEGDTGTFINIRNGRERLRVINLRETADSISFDMPVFESGMRFRKINKDSLSGVWVRQGSQGVSSLPVTARAGLPRFEGATASQPVNGKWSVTFTNNGKASPAIGVFKTNGNGRVTGSIVTPTGDDRFLEGIVRGDSLVLSTFDGVHAMLFTAHLKDSLTLDGGMFFSGAKAYQRWTAVRNDTATIPDLAAMHQLDGARKLDFTFPDLDGKPVSLHDFKGKVVVIQLMGSWCPNCMDETAYLSDWYRENRGRGIEVIALAYEYSTDPVRSKASLEKFRKRFDVTYPMLNTGVTVSDSLNTQKTLPGFSPIKTYPTTIVMDRRGNVRKVLTDFSGPGTGEFYERYKSNFESLMDTLASERP